MLLTKESELSLVLFLVKLMHCLNTILCIFHWHTEQKDVLTIKIFINLFFTTCQAIPFKRNFFIIWLRYKSVVISAWPGCRCGRAQECQGEITTVCLHGKQLSQHLFNVSLRLKLYKKADKDMVAS